LEIHAGDIDRQYRIIGPIRARTGAATAFSKAPTMEDVNFKLREVALKRGANAVINVQYSRGISAMSWKAMTATGTAVVVEPDERQCPHCAETIKREARVCRFCGRDLEPLQLLPQPENRAEEWKPDPSGRHPDRYSDGEQWTKWVRDKPGGTRLEDPPWT
jgi:hypothetical protein